MLAYADHLAQLSARKGGELRCCRPSVGPGGIAGQRQDHCGIGKTELHTVQALQPTQPLQVFTTAGEWVVRGVPLTPSGLQLELQTRVGSWTGRRLQPVTSTAPHSSSGPAAASCASSSTS